MRSYTVTVTVCRSRGTTTTTETLQARTMQAAMNQYVGVCLRRDAGVLQSVHVSAAPCPVKSTPPLKVTPDKDGSWNAALRHTVQNHRFGHCDACDALALERAHYVEVQTSEKMAEEYRTMTLPYCSNTCALRR